MRNVLIVWAVGAALSATPGLAAPRSCAVVRVRSQVAAAHVSAVNVAVVPFAVPVAVPVAVVSQPGVSYFHRLRIEPGSAKATVEEEPALRVEQAAADARRAAEALLVARCAHCHRAEASASSPIFFDAAGQLLARLPRQRMLDAVESGRMPKGQAPLTAEEVQQLRDWARPPRDLEY